MFNKRHDSTRAAQTQERRRERKHLDTYDDYNERVRRASAKTQRQTESGPTYGYREEQSLPVSLWVCSMAAVTPEGEYIHCCSYLTVRNQEEALDAGYDTALRVYPEQAGYGYHDVNVVMVEPVHMAMVLEALRS